MTGVRLRLARLRGVQAVTELGRRRASTGDMPGADAAFRLAVRSGDARIGLPAALHLWVLRARQGDSVSSGEAYREAVRLAARAESTSAGEACVHIGRLVAAGRSTLPGAGEAGMAFRGIVNAGDLDLAPKAALGLAVLLWELDRPAVEVRAAFRLAINSGHPDCVPTAEKWFALYPG